MGLWSRLWLAALNHSSCQKDLLYHRPRLQDNVLSKVYFHIKIQIRSRPVFCLMLRVSSHYAQPYTGQITVYPKKYAHGFVVLCFVVVMQSFIMNSHEVFIHIHQGCFAGTGAIVRLPQCQWSKPDGYGKISQCITTTKHSKAKTVCIFLGIYCTVITCPVIVLLRARTYPEQEVENGPSSSVLACKNICRNKTCEAIDPSMWIYFE